MGRDHTSTTLDKLLNLGALLVGECGNIGENERAELFYMRLIQQTIMDHLKWNSRFH